MDPLSDVLSLLKPRSYNCGGLDTAGDWSIGFGQHAGIKCYAVISGSLWMVVEGVEAPVRLASGDCFLLPRGRPFRVTTDLSLPATDYRAVFKTPMNGRIITINGGGESAFVGGHFVLDGPHAEILLGMLPPIVRIREETDKETLRWSMDRLGMELREPRPGSYLVAQHLAYMMLLQALRLHLAEGLTGGVGWLFALADKQMSAAISAMHAAPGQRWTLQALAETAGMSRSSFALKFRETVGTSAMEYLTQWRMLLAGDRLAHSGEPISIIALSLGYDSESAFSTAFKRVMGCAPRQYGRGRILPSPEPEPEETEPEPITIAS
jgi:AraC-like DNA-binding protein